MQIANQPIKILPNSSMSKKKKKIIEALIIRHIKLAAFHCKVEKSHLVS